MNLCHWYFLTLFFVNFCLSAVACFAGDATTPIAVEAAPTAFARFFPASETFGELQFRGGLILSSSDPRFGGFSGLALSGKGDALIAVSDDGWWFKGDVHYENGRPARLTNTSMAPLLGENGRRPSSKRRRDAEAIALDPPGEIGASVYVAFEMRTRIEKFDMRAKGLAARPVSMSTPPALAKGPTNAQLEALGKLTQGRWKGSLIAASERNLDKHGNIKAWIIGGGKSRSFSISRYEDYDITDLAVLPDGSIITLERSFARGSLPGMAIRKFAIAGLKEGDTLSPGLLFSGRQPFYLIDNMEGIAVHRWRDEMRISIISDDNYNRGVQQTVIYQFALPR